MIGVWKNQQAREMMLIKIETISVDCFNIDAMLIQCVIHAKDWLFHDSAQSCWSTYHNSIADSAPCGPAECNWIDSHIVKWFQNYNIIVKINATNIWRKKRYIYISICLWIQCRQDKCPDVLPLMISSLK